jgi:hypothetical protein
VFETYNALHASFEEPTVPDKGQEFLDLVPD